MVANVFKKLVKVAMFCWPQTRRQLHLGCRGMCRWANRIPSQYPPYGHVVPFSCTVPSEQHIIKTTKSWANSWWNWDTLQYALECPPRAQWEAAMTGRPFPMFWNGNYTLWNRLAFFPDCIHARHCSRPIMSVLRLTLTTYMYLLYCTWLHTQYVRFYM